MVRISRRRFALAVCHCSLTVAASGCGTLLYPERRGQPKGQLDWGVVALDGLGLLLFVVPGIIAFAVDFGSGAIYLPPGPYIDGYSDAGRGDEHALTERRLDPRELTPDRLAEVVSEHIGRPVRLDETRCHRTPLRNLGEFWATRDRLLTEIKAESEPGILRAQSDD